MQIPRTEISSLGEFGLIDRLTQKFARSTDTLKGVGDDAAVVKFNKENTLITTDFLVENIHFDLAYTPLKHLGYKSVVVNLSDIYAMNGTPKHITVSIALSNRFSVEALEELYSGIELACSKYDVDLIGGDTTTSDKGLIISVTAIGEANQSDIVYRSGAKVGDKIGVTGNLGAAFLGLHLLQREKEVYLANPNMQPELNENNAYLIERFLKPEAQKSFVTYLHQHKVKLHAMMDISDGLSSEIFHICKSSQVGAVVHEAQIPMVDMALTTAEALHFDPSMCALNGGEDYELLFTCSLEEAEKLDNCQNITWIGDIKPASQGIKLLSRGNNLYDMKAQGWLSF